MQTVLLSVQHTLLHSTIQQLRLGFRACKNLSSLVMHSTTCPGESCSQQSASSRMIRSLAICVGAFKLATPGQLQKSAYNSLAMDTSLVS